MKLKKKCRKRITKPMGIGLALTLLCLIVFMTAVPSLAFGQTEESTTQGETQTTPTPEVSVPTATPTVADPTPTVETKAAEEGEAEQEGQGESAEEALMLQSAEEPVVQAAAETVGSFSVKGGAKDTDYSYTNNVLTILKGTAMTISMATDATTPTTDTIVVASSVTANITLSGVSIDVKDTENACAMAVSSGVTLNLTLEGDNTLKSSSGYAGLSVEQGAKLTITGKKTDNSDKLTATSAAYGAGIGGNNGADGGDITINGGTINATGIKGSNRRDGAGIGSGNGGTIGTITITGGIINATGGAGAAGIGGGNGWDTGNGKSSSFTAIIISGGIVTATGGGYFSNDYFGAGIGSGRLGGGTGTITISGGSIKAITYTQCNAASIGSGKDSTATITTIITGGKFAAPTASTPIDEVYGVTVANGYRVVANTESEKETYPYKVELITNDLKVTGGNEGTDYSFVQTGGGYLSIKTETPLTISMETKGNTTVQRIVIENSKTANLTLNGVSIDTSAYTNTGAFIIGEGATLNLTLNGDNVLKSGANYAGLSVPPNAALTIPAGSTGSLTAIGGTGGAGIGGNNGFASGSITIKSGMITANAGNQGAGIGGGAKGVNGTSITITGGTINATGGGGGGSISGGGAGIGGGQGGSFTSILIDGGTVSAAGGANSGGSGAGIGSGSGSWGTSTQTATIEIKSGSIGGSTNSIGEGYGSNIVKTITIEGGKFANSSGIDKVYYATVASGRRVVANTEDDKNIYSYQVITITNDLTVTATNGTVQENTDYDFVQTGGGYLFIKTNKPLIISMKTEGSTTVQRIVIENNKTANLTLKGVSIDTSAYSLGAFTIGEGATLNLTLNGDNSLKSGINCAGLSVGNTALLTITEASNGSKLTATGGLYGAGIGGGQQGNAGAISIAGGTITATGGGGGAGIGGGDSGSFTSIIISDGIVGAKGGGRDAWVKYGAGIGGGYLGKGTGTIDISGGKIKADFWPSGSAAFIGAGESGTVGTTTITGGHFAVGDLTTKTVYGITPPTDCTVWEDTSVDGYTFAVSKEVQAPTPTVSVDATASSLTITLLAETDKYGEAQYSIDGSPWQDSNIFTGLKAGTSHTLSAKYTGEKYYTASEVGSTTASTNAATYTVTIPSTVTAGGSSESITASSLNLGYNGQVAVKVASGITNGKVRMTNADTAITQTLTSAMSVNGNPFTDTTQNVAAFTANGANSVPVSFLRPILADGSSGTIPAGVYSGTVSFSITYSETN